MASTTDLVTAKKNLAGALGENMSLYLQLLKQWFKQKLTREDFDHDARKLLTMDSVHLHNQFMLAILTKCQSLGSPSVKQSSEVLSSSSATQSPSKLKKLKTKKRLHSTSQKVSFNQRLTSVNQLATALQIPTHVPVAEEKGPGFASRDMLLPDIGLVHCRLLVTAWENGLETIQDDTVALLFKAIQVQLKNVLSAVISRRSGYKVREKKFKYAYGTEVANYKLRNSFLLEDYSTESEGSSVTLNGYHIPSVKPSPEIGYRNAAVEVASTYPTRSIKEKINLFDLYYALQKHKSVIPSHTVYTTNMERIVNKLWHPSNEELQQETIHKKEVQSKQDLLTRQQLASFSLRT